MQRRNMRNQDEVKKEPEEQAEGSYDVEEQAEDSYDERKVQVGRSKLVKIFHAKQKDSENEDPTNDNKKETQKGLKRFIKKKIVSETTVPKVKGKLSTYEQMVKKNREEKMAFLQSLKIDEIKSDLSEAVESVKKRPKPTKRKFQKKDYSPPILRKSRRLANLNVDLSEDALYVKALKNASEAEEVRQLQLKLPNSEWTWKRTHNKHRKRRRKLQKSYQLKQHANKPSLANGLSKTIPPELSFKEALDNEDVYEDYVKNINIEESKSETKFIKYDKSDLNNMTLAESNIAKITPSRITALTWYPSPEQLIVAGADKYGNLGILNVNSQSNPYLMKIHLEGITNLRFSPFNQVQLISSSYDGILRCGDMVHNKFNEIYNVYDTTCCTYFDLLSASTFLVAQKNGQVAVVDRRTEGKSSEKKHDCHESSIKTVSAHPVDTSYFISADNRGCIRLWDLRKLQKNPVADLKYHERCVQSAYFSPVTGNSILATSSDDSVSIFDSSNLTSKLNLRQRMKHNNQTGRWLSVFRATWLPNSEESFVIGSMDYPRKIQVFDKNMFVYNMMDENLTICSTNVFHPTRHALAGGNSSGKLFVFI